MGKKIAQLQIPEFGEINPQYNAILPNKISSFCLQPFQIQHNKNKNIPKKEALISLS